MTEIYSEEIDPGKNVASERPNKCEKHHVTLFVAIHPREPVSST
jgi:hypothetical protein